MTCNAPAFTVYDYGMIIDNIGNALDHSGAGTASITNAGSIIRAGSAIQLDGEGGNKIVSLGTISTINETAIILVV